jgi:APA family basic amino acid/polyamine antiporter
VSFFDTQPGRTIGVVGATSVVAGSMLGVGVFLVPRLVAEQVDNVVLFLSIWGLGGLVALAGALAYAELGGMFPHAGGDYVYLRQSLGPSAGFAGGWVLLAGVFAGSIASMSVAVCRYQLATLVPAFDPDAVIFVGVTAQQLLAVGVVIALTALNAWGVRPSTRAQTALTVAPVVVLLCVGAYALVTAPHPSYQPIEVARGTTAGGLAAAFLQVYFAYAGWNAVSYVGGEVEAPARNLPRALLGGTALVTVLYLLLCGAFLVVLGLGGLRGAFEAGTQTARALFGAEAEWAVALLIAVAIIGSLNATVLGGARIAFAMARDQILPKKVARVHRRTQVPTRALVLQAAFASALILSGTFAQLVELTSVAMLLLGGLTVTGFFVLRFNAMRLPRPYLAFAYPWLPGFYVLASVVVIGLSLWRSVVDSEPYPIAGLALFGALFVGHRAWLRRLQRQEQRRQAAADG